MIHLGEIANPEVLEKVTGQKVHPEAFDYRPTGARVHVVLEEVPESFGMIRLTEQSRQKEPVGTGWIMAVGPLCSGYLNCPYPGTVQCDEPIDLLYAHIIFGASVGMPLRFDITDKDFKAEVLVMETRAIRGIDTNMKSHIARRAVAEFT